MSEHPIENLMKTTMNSIKDMVDVNTIVGEPIETINNTVIVPVSKVCFGFAAGGTDFCTNNMCKSKEKIEELPFGGGSGAAVDIVPVGFIIMDSVNFGKTKFIPVEHSDAIDKLLDYVPDLLEKTKEVVNKFLDDNEVDESEEAQDENRESEEENNEKETIIINLERDEE